MSSSNLGDKKGTWFQALRAFTLPILLFLILRWALFEPFVIPSGSMIPTLQIHDHLLVKKYSYGLKWPFTSSWIVQWSSPDRGDIVVFKYPKNQKLFFIKRVLGLPGDRLRFENHRLYLNGVEVSQEKLSQVKEENAKSSSYREYDYFTEKLDSKSYTVRYLRSSNEFTLEFNDQGDAEISSSEEFIIPEDTFFMVGDNRDESSDSRVWGVVRREALVGEPLVILMGCRQSLQSSQFCNPQHLQWDRFLKVP